VASIVHGGRALLTARKKSTAGFYPGGAVGSDIQNGVAMYTCTCTLVQYIDMMITAGW
jgi:hypothetical protein